MYEIEPFKTAMNYDRKICSYDPKQTNCCYEISSIFRDAPTMEERFISFVNADPENQYPIRIRFRPPLDKIDTTEQELFKLERLLKNQEFREKITRIGIRKSCEFIRQYILQNITYPNKEIKGFNMLVPFCRFIDGFSAESRMVNGTPWSESATLYPLNIAYELDDKDLFSKLVENGAYRFSYGFFYSLDGSEQIDDDMKWSSQRGYWLYPKMHCLENFLSYVDDKHYKLLYDSLKNKSSFWREKLDSLESYFSPEKPKAKLFITLGTITR